MLDISALKNNTNRNISHEENYVFIPMLKIVKIDTSVGI